MMTKEDLDFLEQLWTRVMINTAMEAHYGWRPKRTKAFIDSCIKAGKPAPKQKTSSLIFDKRKLIIAARRLQKAGYLQIKLVRLTSDESKQNTDRIIWDKQPDLNPHLENVAQETRLIWAKSKYALYTAFISLADDKILRLKSRGKIPWKWYEDRLIIGDEVLKNARDLEGSKYAIEETFEINSLLSGI